MIAEIEAADVAQPTVESLPRDAKPSEIVRSMASEGCQGRLRIRRLDGSLQHCAAGVLLEQSDFSWGAATRFSPTKGGLVWSGWATDSMKAHLHARYGITPEQTKELQIIHDEHGKDAAADVLESWGL